MQPVIFISQTIILNSPKIDYTILKSITALVTKVIDGDTIEIKLYDGTIDKVRLIGIDTPESVDPRKPVECFSKEATVKMKELVDGSFRCPNCGAEAAE